MQDLIILGLVPGTSLEITFVAWSLFVSGIFSYYSGKYAHRKRLLPILLISGIIAVHTVQLEA
jgi:hypothetical protein